MNEPLGKNKKKLILTNLGILSKLPPKNTYHYRTTNIVKHPIHPNIFHRIQLQPPRTPSYNILRHGKNLQIIKDKNKGISQQRDMMDGRNELRGKNPTDQTAAGLRSVQQNFHSSCIDAKHPMDKTRKCRRTNPALNKFLKKKVPKESSARIN